MQNNPFTLMFGKEPLQMITRLSQMNEIINSFSSDSPTQQIYMITGVRGAGKTVFMTTAAKHFREEKDWVVVELNPEKDLLVGLAAKLYNYDGLKELFNKAKLNLSFFGIGVELEKTEKITDIEVAVSRMLEQLNKHKKKVLITIDEVSNTETMRIFSSAFQIFVRQDYPLFLLMTGLYDNINALQNEKSLTFLYRAPKIYLKELNMGSVTGEYQEIFHLDAEEARKMARLTMGYPFAFQVLGYYTYEKKGSYEDAIRPCRQYLDEYAYDKIWSELSEKDRRVIFVISELNTGRVKDIREKLDMKTNEFSMYRDRLIKKGILNGDEHGYVRLTLPFFADYAKEHCYDDIFL